MNERSVGISQQTLVSGTGDENVPAKKLPQYIASLSSTLGSLAAGMVLGWTNSAGTDGASIKTVYGIEISPTEFSWISSLAFTIGWLLIIFANSVIMFYIGRFISGLSAGAFCVAAPMYSAEIALVSVCIFIIVFSLGFGPLPWMMISEIFGPEIKGVAASSAGLLNWFLAFVVTKFYNDLKTAIDEGPTFWLFSLVSAIGTFFVYFQVPETKGKSLIDIQRELNN